MHPYPHVYQAVAEGGTTDAVAISSPGLQALASTSPPEFDGPPGYWSPETLLCAAAADCFVLTFRAIARNSKFDWTRLECRVEGTLERAQGGARFTRFATHATLDVPAGSDEARAKLLLEKSEAGCLVANSLSGERSLVATVRTG